MTVSLRPHLKRAMTLVLAGAAMALTACAAGESNADRGEQVPKIQDDAAAAKAKGFTEQYAILKKGKVSATDYKDAVDLTIACHRKSGLTVEGPYLNPSNSLTFDYWFGEGQSPAKIDGIDCETRFLSFVQPVYIETHPNIMMEPLRNYVGECLKQKGFEVTGKEISVRDFDKSIGGDQFKTLLSCIMTGTGKLYPEIKSSFISG